MDDKTIARMIEEGAPNPSPGYWDDIRAALHSVDDEVETASRNGSGPPTGRKPDTDDRRSGLSVMTPTTDTSRPRLGVRILVGAAAIAVMLGFGVFAASRIGGPTAVEVAASPASDSTDDTIIPADDAEPTEPPSTVTLTRPAGADDPDAETPATVDPDAETPATTEPGATPGATTEPHSPANGYYTKPELAPYYACLDERLIEDEFPEETEPGIETPGLREIVSTCLEAVPVEIRTEWEAADQFDFGIYTDCLNTELDTLNTETSTDEEIERAHDLAKAACTPLLPELTQQTELAKREHNACLGDNADTDDPMAACAYIGIRWYSHLVPPVAATADFQ